MDAREQGWFGRLQVKGFDRVIEAQGSVLSITAQFLREIQLLQMRGVKQAKLLTIQLSDKPITDSAQPADDSIDDSATIPLVDESYDAFYSRLITLGIAPTVAMWSANDWFNRPQDADYIRWMNDPKAQRFAQLQASNAEFEAALPSEYESLKQYILREYPDRAKQFTFRTA